MHPNSPALSDQGLSRLRTVRPIGVLAIHGIAFLGDELFGLDKPGGLLVSIDPETDSTTVLNPCHVDKFVDATGLAIWEDSLWFVRDDSVYFCSGAIRDGSIAEIEPQHFVSLPYSADGVAVWNSTVYVTCQKAGCIFVFNRTNRKEITRFFSPGIGVENITVRGEELWVCDATEQTVYCLERGTGEVRFNVLTPFESPTGLAFHTDVATGKEVLYVAYAGEELYIRDDPNSEDPYQLTKRDRTFIHPLHFHYNERDRYALSNGFLMEMSYVEELAPLDEVHIDNLEWRIAMPSDTHRQKVRQISPIGMPFTEEIQDGERVAVFKFDPLRAHERRIFGWKALLEVRSIKYEITPRDVEKAPALTPEFQAKYLVDDDSLAMDSEIVRAAAKEAIGTETNILRKLLSIRNYVYDCLSYSIRPHIDTPDVVLRRGTGSCGEYVGVLLALARLNGIACRTIGRYKCPAFADRKGVPLSPDFNHVWLEFYIPGFGWVPMESNPDDIQERGPYPLRFFMGLAWYHVEIGKGIRFQSLKSEGLPLNKEEVSVGTLAINHVRFTILSELPAN
ncbi:transglutaminase family protein [Kamptonema animale CS-326]|jgi:transglutaminase-like putative cysteine protease|uniref:transglutaminase-like domain-containing protein n=1 Tax=Kamptonema animale TaxID=92934 RepID=UPI002330E7B1|nr:transglutaminase family protein [Kamptonema animale]MDB9512865.1 transglutaminase family protein [Kamptonema animale CS-326]